MTDNTPAPAGLLEAMASAMWSIVSSAPWKSVKGTVYEALYRNVAQAAYTAMRAYMASDGVSRFKKLVEDIESFSEWELEYFKLTPEAQKFAAILDAHEKATHRTAAAITPQPAVAQEPWAYGWFDQGGKKHAYPYLPTVNYPGEHVEAFPLYRAPQPDPRDLVGQIKRDAEAVAALPEAKRQSLLKELRIACGETPWLVFPKRQEAQPDPRDAEILTWLANRGDLELSCEAWEAPEEWIVRQVTGGRSDREWHEIAREASPLAALLQARAALKGTGHE